jgi:aryl-alcohol dehydrogenase-like predicted oxidoreductase
MDPTTTAIGTWSGGRFMHFGEPLSDERLHALLRPGEGIDTVITADVYGAGEADSVLGSALEGSKRDSYCLVGAIGHDFYTGERNGAKGFPRFTDPHLRDPREYAAYIRMATERSLERCGVDQFDVLLLHNPDHVGYSSPVVWEGMQEVRDAGLTRLLGDDHPQPAGAMAGRAGARRRRQERRRRDHPRGRLRRRVSRRRATGPLLR